MYIYALFSVFVRFLLLYKHLFIESYFCFYTLCRFLLFKHIKQDSSSVYFNARFLLKRQKIEKLYLIILIAIYAHFLRNRSKFL